MHVLHAILVGLTDGLGESLDDFSIDDVDDLKDDARHHALDATDSYGEGKVFDWRSEDDAGRWAQDFPSNVILGWEEPERLVALVEEHSRRPLEKALEVLKTYMYTDCAWRTKEEIETGGFEVIKNPQNGESGRYWSGRQRPPVTLDEAFLKAIWNDAVSDFDAWLVQQALNLVNGEYEHSSGFYSVPDGCAKISKETLADVKKNPKKYALVFLDYHN